MAALELCAQGLLLGLMASCVTCLEGCIGSIPTCQGPVGGGEGVAEPCRRAGCWEELAQSCSTAALPRSRAAENIGTRKPHQRRKESKSGFKLRAQRPWQGLELTGRGSCGTCRGTGSPAGRMQVSPASSTYGSPQGLVCTAWSLTEPLPVPPEEAIGIVSSTSVLGL